MALFGKKNQPDLSALSALAHRALNEEDSEYARNKALISQFFRNSCAVEHKEEVRLSLIDSLYSTQVASRRLYGITDIAESLRSAFPDDAALKKCAVEWVNSGFETANPLCDLFVVNALHILFAANYGIDKSGAATKSAASLLSKYLYFTTDYSFPIYDALGAKYYSIAGKKTSSGFQKRFRTLKEIMDENSIDGFDQLDNFFWLYGKITTGSFSLVLNKTRYVALMRYAQEKPGAAIVEEVRAGQNAAELKGIFGPALFEFIQNTSSFDQE
jgi:hypothetical protein